MGRKGGSDNEQVPPRESELYDKKWVVQVAPNSKAKCKDKNCLGDDNKIATGEIRIGRRYPSPFKEDEIAVNWFHAKCMFDQQMRSRKGTQVIQRPEDMDGFYELPSNEQHYVEQLIDDFQRGHLNTSSESKPHSSKSTPRTRDAKSSRTSVDVESKEIAKKKKKAEGGRRDVGRVIML
jgi:hypothetical protein